MKLVVKVAETIVSIASIGEILQKAVGLLQTDDKKIA
jgi:hypothetical protein